jgi:hypothetical protein
MGPGLLLLFVVGDILGTGVYALTGDVAAESVGQHGSRSSSHSSSPPSPRSVVWNWSPSIRRRQAQRSTRTRLLAFNS